MSSQVPQKLSPGEAQSLSRTAVLNGRTYKYLLSEPQAGPPKATIFLIHGFPDCSFGWRYQVPFLTKLGIRVVVPDMLGYGGTDAPRVPPNNISLYGFKSVSDDLAALAKELGAPKIILGGHDWGGMVVYRFAQYYPELVTHVFSVCTPFFAPREQFVPLDYLVANFIPQFGYQLQLSGPDLEARVQSKEDIAKFLNGLYGGATDSGKPFLTPKRGVDLALFDKGVGKSPLLSEEETSYYVEQFSRNGMHGPLNWYRTQRANFDSQEDLKTGTVEQPVLFIMATDDIVLGGDLAKSMPKLIPNLTSREVKAGHWALWQAAKDVNGHVEQWLADAVFAGKSHL